MPKVFFQDIVPPEKRSIKNIPVPHRSPGKRIPTQQPSAADIDPRPTSSRPESFRYMKMSEPAVPKLEEEELEPEEDISEVDDSVEPNKKKKGGVLSFILIIILLLGAGVAAYFFVPRASGAKVVVVPRGQPISANFQFTASRDSSSNLLFQVADYKKDGRMSIPAKEEEYVETKAQGTIRIFNDFSTAAQKLIANTRFESSNGLIFRISQAVTIPGRKGKAPGSIDITVVAEKVGANYNIGLVDFTIPGFKGEPKFEKIFARSVTEMKGGFKGTRKKVDEAQLKIAREKIRAELQATLIRQMRQNVPKDFVFPNGAYFIEYESLPDIFATSSVQINERAAFHGLMFERTALARALSQKVNGVAGKHDDISSADTLVFSTKSASTSKSWEQPSIAFSLNGSTSLISSIDTEKLKNELLGKPRNSVNAILAGYPEIAYAEVTISPVWKQSFPENPAEISIELDTKTLSP